jgi:hypothetical protein
VYIVLAFLGVLTFVAAPLARVGSWVVAGVGIAALLLAPWLNGLATAWTPNQLGGVRTYHLVTFLVVGGPDFDGPYQLASMVFFAALGILATRHLLDGPAAAVGLVCGAATAFGVLLYETGTVTMLPYHVTFQVLTFDAVLILAIFLVGVAVAHQLPTLVEPLAGIGSMSFSLYSLQILWLWYDVTELHPGASDDSWLNVVLLTGGSVALAYAWRAAVHIEPWRRGPLEGPVALLVGALTRRRVRV